jgi:NADPH:quinone reductase-like Zn-dependent oxidoreductase
MPGIPAASSRDEALTGRIVAMRDGAAGIFPRIGSMRSSGHVGLELPLDELVEQVAAGTLRVQVGKVFKLDEIVEAHRCMEENKAGGKIVVLT